MRQTISKRLAPLASLAAQRRYIVHGTREEYLVPEQLLEDAHTVVRQVCSIPAAAASLSPDAVAAIVTLESLLSVVGTTEQSGEQLIESDPAWRAVREQAARCLDILGFDLREWEQMEGLNHAA